MLRLNMCSNTENGCHHWQLPSAQMNGRISGWYNPTVLPDLGLGDILRLRKPHPCGGYEWRVVRLGADIGLECLNCGRRVLLERRQLKNRLKTVVQKAEDDQSLHA